MRKHLTLKNIKSFPLAGVLLLVLTFVWHSTAYAQGPIIKDVKTDVAFDQNLNGQVPLDTVFVDDNGNRIRLGDYFSTKPIILTLNYFSCQNLCSLELDQLDGALADLSFNLGDEYDVISLSFDPRDTPDLAAETKWQYVRDYARPGKGDGWHFLTGDESQIQQVTQAVGFHYAYDPKTNDFAHPLGLMVLTPQGKIARYIYGLDYNATDLKLALMDASQNKIGSAVDQILSLCYHYDPANGRYSSIVFDIVRVSGALTVLALGTVLGRQWWHDYKASKSA